MKVGLEAARWLIYRAAASLGASRDASLHAAIAKLFVSEKFVEVARDAVQLMGGYGYMVESEVERVMRDALGRTIYSGPRSEERRVGQACVRTVRSRCAPSHYKTYETENMYTTAK